MISRRELLRRLGLSTIAVAAAPVVAKLNELPLPKHRIKKPVKAPTLPTGVSQLSINGQVVGRIVRFSHETQSPVIDVTNIHSASREYITHYTNRVALEIIPGGGGYTSIQDILSSGHISTIVLWVDGASFEFEGYILSHSISAGLADFTMQAITIEVTGEVVVV